MTASRMTEALVTERLEAELVSGRGTVKLFDSDGGLISADEGDDDLPFRVRNVVEGVGVLEMGQRVEFVVDEGSHGLEAFRIAPLEWPATEHP